MSRQVNGALWILQLSWLGSTPSKNVLGTTEKPCLEKEVKWLGKKRLNRLNCGENFKGSISTSTGLDDVEERAREAATGSLPLKSKPRIIDS